MPHTLLSFLHRKGPQSSVGAGNPALAQTVRVKRSNIPTPAWFTNVVGDLADGKIIHPLDQSRKKHIYLVQYKEQWAQQ